MSNSPRLGVQLVPDGAMDLDQPFNNLARQLDQVLNVRVLSATTAAQPGAPASGALYIIPAAATGTNWAGKAAGTLALFDSGTWYFTTPAGFIVAHVADTGAVLAWSGTAWVNHETLLGAKGADIAAAATVTLANATGDFIHVTGTGGPITSFGTAKAGLERTLVHDAAHTLTHGVNIINLTGANIVTAAGDISKWRGEGGTVWRMMEYSRAAFAANTFMARASIGPPESKPISDFGLSLVDDANAAAARATLGAVPGNVLVRAYRAALQTVAPGAFATIVFDTENYDVGSNYNIATGEFTVPAQGVYAISAFIHAKNLADASQLATSIFVNGVEAARLGEESVSNPAADANLAVVNGSATYYRLAAGDVVTARWFCSASVAGDCVVSPGAGTGSWLTYFFITLLFAE